MSFLGWEAAVAAGLDLERWEQGGYTTRFMAKTIAWYKLHKLVNVHQEAAMVDAQKRAQRRK